MQNVQGSLTVKFKLYIPAVSYTQQMQMFHLYSDR